MTKHSRLANSESIFPSPRCLHQIIPILKILMGYCNDSDIRERHPKLGVCSSPPRHQAPVCNTQKKA